MALIEAGACDHVFDRQTHLNLSKFSAPQQRLLAFGLKNARARGLVAWHTRHFLCFSTLALTTFRCYVVQPVLFVLSDLQLSLIVGGLISLLFFVVNQFQVAQIYFFHPESEALTPRPMTTDQGTSNSYFSHLRGTLGDAPLAAVLTLVSSLALLVVVIGFFRSYMRVQGQGLWVLVSLVVR